jgi:hypothetical protein
MAATNNSAPASVKKAGCGCGAGEDTAQCCTANTDRCRACNLCCTEAEYADHKAAAGGRRLQPAVVTWNGAELPTRKLGVIAAVCAGFAWMVLLYTGAHVSGAHYNPAVRRTLLRIYRSMPYAPKRFGVPSVYTYIGRQ